jgi:hypothetical protein
MRTLRDELDPRIQLWKINPFVTVYSVIEACKKTTCAALFPFCRCAPYE